MSAIQKYKVKTQFKNITNKSLSTLKYKNACFEAYSYSVRLSTQEPASVTFDDEKGEAFIPLAHMKTCASHTFC